LGEIFFYLTKVNFYLIKMGNCCVCEEYIHCHIYLEDFLEKKARFYTINATKTREVSYRYGSSTSHSEEQYSQDLCASCNRPIGNHIRRPNPTPNPSTTIK